MGFNLGKISADNPDEYGKILFSFVYFIFRKGKGKENFAISHEAG